MSDTENLYIILNEEILYVKKIATLVSFKNSIAEF